MFSVERLRLNAYRRLILISDFFSNLFLILPRDAGNETIMKGFMTRVIELSTKVAVFFFFLLVILILPFALFENVTHL